MHNEVFETNKNISEIKIALLSDIHYYEGYNLKIFNKIIKQITNTKPNYVCIAGDILDTSDTTEITPLKEFLTTLSNICPIIAVLGNHDEKKGYMGEWSYEPNNALRDFLNTSKNIYLLDDTRYIDKDNNICFYGYNLSYHYYEVTDEDYKVFEEETNKLKETLNNDTYNITLIHTPINIFKYLKENNTELSKTNLILAGHMHNGGIPFIITHTINKLFKSSRSLFSPLKKFFPKYAQGRVYNEKVDAYIYEGLSKLSHSTRLFHYFDFIFSKNIEIITIKKSSK